MLLLNQKPRWIDLPHDVRVEVQFVGSTMIQEVWEEMAGQEGDQEEDHPIDPVLLAKAVARRAITAWEGVGDADGKPAQVTPENIDALLEITAILTPFRRQVVDPALAVVAEGNV